MTAPSVKERADHMLEAIDLIRKELQDFSTAQDLSRNRFVQLGVERCLEIISEASRHLPDELKTAHPHIPWRRVVDMGNRLRHAYHGVDSGVIWQIVKEDLLTLKIAIVAMRDAAE